MDLEGFSPLCFRFIIYNFRPIEYKLHLRRDFVGMDSKQIKNLLKQAKEAIKKKEITTALSLCKVNFEKRLEITCCIYYLLPKTNKTEQIVTVVLKHCWHCLIFMYFK